MAIAGVALLAASIPAAVALRPQGISEVAGSSALDPADPAPVPSPDASPPAGASPAPDASPESATPAPEERTTDDAPEPGSDVSELLEDEGGDAAATGYAVVTDGAGALRLEVPLGWDHATGEESETGEGGRNWSDFAGEGHKASITAAPSLDAWEIGGGVPGIYAVASKALARGYTDEQLVASGPFDLSSSCEPGARSDFGRGPYSGRMQAWHNCEVDPAATFVTLSAAPEGRECVVLMQLAMYGEADVEVGQHILDAFEVACAAATYPLAVAADEQYAPYSRHHNR